MSSLKSLNKNNAAVKRIMQEARELANDPSTDYSAAPLENDIFVSRSVTYQRWASERFSKEWHCTLRGPAGTEYDGGLYHFRILLPAEYPFRPPSMMMLTPNGRFELNTKICISFTNYHEELWQPAWGVRTAILGLQGFFPLKGQAAVGVGSIECTVSERKRLAALSREWVCPQCQQPNLELLPDPPATSEGTLQSEPDNTQQSGPISENNAPSAPFSTPRPTDLPSPNSTTPMHEDETPIIVHAVDPLVPSRPVGQIAPHTPSASFINRPTDQSPVGHNSSPTTTPPVAAMHQTSQKLPLLLDTTICVLLVLISALICRHLF